MLGRDTGVTAAIFGFVHAVLLAPLPYARPEAFGVLALTLAALGV